MTTRKYSVKATVEYSRLQYDTLHLVLHGIEIDDYDEPISDAEIKEILEDEIYLEFDRRIYDSEFSSITDLEFEREDEAC